jgi:chromosome segregation ATPase
MLLWLLLTVIFAAGVALGIGLARWCWYDPEHINWLQARIEDWKGLVAEARQDLSDASAECLALRQRVAELEADNKKTDASLAAACGECSKARAERDRQSGLADLERVKLEQTTRQAKLSLDCLKDENQRLRDVVAMRDGEIEHLQRRRK